MKILFCGGGTAGHVNPALAIAEELIRRDKSTEVAFVGRKGGNENELIIKAGFKLYTVNIFGLSRKLNLKTVKSLFAAIAAKKEALQIIKSFKPDAVVGTGGYVSWPVISAANNLHIPTVLHESNSAPGLVSRLLGKKCTRLLLGCEDRKRKLCKLKNARIIGNPLRGDFGKLDRRAARAKLGIREHELLIVSVGGSIGAQKINDTVIAVMKSYCLEEKHIKHVHSVGKRYFDEVKKSAPLLCRGIRGCRIVPYIHDMAIYLTAADIAITRCGAMTLSELALTAPAVIFIPSPNVTADHQRINAKSMTDKGAGIMLEESELSESSLKAALYKLVNDKDAREGYSHALKEFARPRACEDASDEIASIIERKVTNSAQK